MLEALSLPFFQRVLIAGLLASVACGVIGSYVVARRMSSLAGGLAHAAFGGVGLGYLLGFPPMLGAAVFGVAAALGVGSLERRAGASFDVWISAAWAVGMSLGIVFIALAPGYAPDLMSYLFGSLLFVSWEYVAVIAALDVLILFSVWMLFDAFQAVCFDEEFAEVAGLPAERLSLALLALAALAIVTLIRVVGIILAVALLTLPAAAARAWSHRLSHMMAIASALCALAITVGLALSYALSARLDLAIPPGALIVLVAVAIYAVSAARRSARN
jgi:zinc transport system permease protein